MRGMTEAGVATVTLVAAMIAAGVGGPVLADEADPAPDSALYGLERAGEAIKRPFADDATWLEDRAIERMDEYEQMVNEEKQSKNQQLLQDARDRAEELEDMAETERDMERVRNVYQKHVRVLERVRDRVPENALAGVDTALEESRQGLDRAEDRTGDIPI